MKVDEIESIEFVGYEDTVDIEVDGDKLFFCNGILTHNSAAGDVTDVTEESIQGGISKIQSADNVLAMIPSATSREMGMLTMKFLKTRDSGGVGSRVSFKTDWSTLTFEPTDLSSGETSAPPKGNTIPKTDANGEFERINKGRNPALEKKTDGDGESGKEEKSNNPIANSVKGMSRSRRSSKLNLAPGRATYSSGKDAKKI